MLTRRQLLGRLGWATAGAAAASTGLLTWARKGAALTPSALSPVQSPVIRTLLGDLSLDEVPAGAVLFHEHLSMVYPPTADSHFTDDVGMMVEEARAARADGIALIVDGGHPDMQRDLAALRRISTESGLPVVASGGYYMQTTYPADIAAKTAEQIADDLVEEARRDGLGAFGEIGQAEGTLTADEAKVFEAVGIAQARTGLPVFTHNAYNIRATDVPRDAALRQLDILESAGADPSHVAIGHVCCLDDPSVEIASEIARRGAFVGFDRVTLNFSMPDENRVMMAMALIEAGHGDRLLLSSDFASARALRSNDGPGLGQTETVFGPMLLEAGLPEATLRSILDENPRRFLAVTPRDA